MNLAPWIELIHARRQTGRVELPADAAPRLQKLAGIRAVVFDIYGTLFSSGVGDISLASEQDRNDALQATLSDNDIRLTRAGHATRIDAMLHTWIQKHQEDRRAEGIEYPEVEIRDVWVDFIQDLVTLELVEPDFDADIQTLVIDYETRVNPTQAMPHLVETLEALYQRELTMSIISNAQFYSPLLFDTFLNQDFQQLGFCPECSVWSYDILEGKPSKNLYEISAKQLQQHHEIAAEQVLYVGNDMRNDIWPAQLVGFKTALFAGDRRSLRRRQDHPNCKDRIADIEITDLLQLLDCI